jgi:hypothetical protein
MRRERSGRHRKCPNNFAEFTYFFLRVDLVTRENVLDVVTTGCEDDDVELDTIAKAIDDLIAAGPSAYCDGASMMQLLRQSARLESFVTAATAEFDQWGEWANDGARTAAAWVCTRAHVPMKDARRRVTRGRALRHMPSCAQAFSDGTISAAHVDALVGLRRPRTEEALTRDEGLLVEQAATMGYQDFTRALSYWEQLADPDGTEERAQAQRDRRDAYIVPSIDGMYLGKMNFDPIAGEIVAGEHNRIEREFFEADWAEAKERLGYEPSLADLTRTPAHRRADAFVEMALRSRSAPADGRRPAPLFSVFVGYETLHGRICQLANGAVVSPGSLIRWLEGADIERAVFTPSGRVEVSATARFFTGATRRAIELRDRQCTHSYCNEPLDRCQCDHIEPASQGGPTTQENGRLLCAFHNRLRNGRPPPSD